MGGSESRCCADAPEEKGVAEKGGEEFGKNAESESPTKATRILHDDPRSPTQSINRTPIEVEATPVQPKPLRRVQPTIGNDTLRNRHGNKSDASAANLDVFQLDPRSPAPPGVRTPIVTKPTTLASREQSTTIACVTDPRSPSQGIVRTPLLVEECKREVENSLAMYETPKKHQKNVQDGMSNPNFCPDVGVAPDDPRSPTQGIHRTPVVNLEKPDHEIDAIGSRCLHDPRSPTVEVNRTPIGALFSGHRELRRTVLLTNALMASPMNKKITQGNSVDGTGDDKECMDEIPGSKESSPVEDEIPAVLRCSFDFNDSCSSSLVASIGSEVDCISFDDNFEDNEISPKAVCTVKEDLIEDNAVSIGKVHEEHNHCFGMNENECEGALQQTNEVPALPDLLSSTEMLKDREAVAAKLSIFEENPVETAEMATVDHMPGVEAVVSEGSIQILNQSACDEHKEMNDAENATEVGDSGSVEIKDIPSPTQRAINIFREELCVDDVEGSFLPNDVAEQVSSKDHENADSQNKSISSQQIKEIQSSCMSPTPLSDVDWHARAGKTETLPIPQIPNCSVSVSLSEECNADPSLVSECDQVDSDVVSECFARPGQEQIICDSVVLQHADIHKCKSSAQDVSLFAIEEISIASQGQVVSEETSTKIDCSDVQRKRSEVTKEKETEQPAGTSIKMLQSGQEKKPGKKPVRRLRTPTKVSHRRRKSHSVTSASTEGSQIYPVNRSAGKSTLLRRPKAKSASDDTKREGSDQENFRSLNARPSRKSESKLVTPSDVRSPLAVLTNDAKTKGDVQSTFSPSPAKGTRLPKYQGTPPIAVNLSLSVSFSGRTSSRSYSVEEQKGGQRSFTYGKEN